MSHTVTPPLPPSDTLPSSTIKEWGDTYFVEMPHGERVPLATFRKILTLPKRCYQWAVACFNQEIVDDLKQRSVRHLEESAELAQCLHVSEELAHEVIHYVYNRPKGELSQEIAGSFTTLVVLAQAAGIDIYAVAEAEYQRINTPEMIEKIRFKNLSKPMPVDVISP